MAELSVTSTDSPKQSLFTILYFPKLIKKKIDIPTMGIKNPQSYSGKEQVNIGSSNELSGSLSSPNNKFLHGGCHVIYSSSPSDCCLATGFFFFFFPDWKQLTMVHKQQTIKTEYTGAQSSGIIKYNLQQS